MIKVISVFVGTALAIFLCVNVIMIQGAFKNDKQGQSSIAIASAQLDQKPQVDAFLLFADDQSDLASTLNDIAPAAGDENTVNDEGFGEYFAHTKPNGFSDIIPAKDTNQIESGEFDL